MTGLELSSNGLRAVLARVIRGGCVYLSNPRLGRRFALRACLVNHRTTARDLDAVVAETLAAASEVSTAGQAGG